MTSPFQQMSGGPSITPATMQGTNRGGQQNPGYLQMKKPVAPGMAPTKPVVTPQASVMGDTVRPQPPITPMGQQSRPTPAPVGPPVTPAGQAAKTPAQAGGNSLGDVYRFFASDLQNQAKQAKSNAISDASARGVYYGTPLTGSEADIDTQYLRGLGQLQAGMYGNEQQNQLARLGMAVNVNAMGGMNAPPSPGPMDFSGLGALFGSGNSQAPNAPGTAPRQGPVVTPNKKPATPPYDPAGLSL